MTIRKFIQSLWNKTHNWKKRRSIFVCHSLRINGENKFKYVPIEYKLCCAIFMDHNKIQFFSGCLHLMKDDFLNKTINTSMHILLIFCIVSSLIKILSNSNTITIKLLQIFLINSGFYKSQNPIKFHKTVNNTMAKVWDVLQQVSPSKIFCWKSA